MKISSTRLLENLTLSNDRIKNDKVNKLINWIIRKLDLIAIAFENNKIDSGVVDQTKNCLKTS